MYMHIYALNCSEDSFVSDLNEFMNLTQRLGGWDIWRLRKFSVFFSTLIGFSCLTLCFAYGSTHYLSIFILH